MTSRSRLFMVLATMLSPACTATIRLLSVPDGALVVWTDGRTGDVLRTVAPVDIRMSLAHRQLVTLSHPGYAPLTVDLRRSEASVVRFAEAGVWTRGMREVAVMLQPVAPPTP